MLIFVVCSAACSLTLLVCLCKNDSKIIARLLKYDFELHRAGHAVSLNVGIKTMELWNKRRLCLLVAIESEEAASAKQETPVARTQAESLAVRDDRRLSNNKKLIISLLHVFPSFHNVFSRIPVYILWMTSAEAEISNLLPFHYNINWTSLQRLA